MEVSRQEVGLGRELMSPRGNALSQQVIYTV